MEKIIERFHLTLKDLSNTLQDNKPDEWTDILRHQVPIGINYLLTKSDTFGLYLVDKEGLEMPADTMIRLEVRDATEQEKLPVELPLYYIHLSRSPSKLYWLDKELNIRQIMQRWWIVISVFGSKAIDIQRSLVDLHTTRMRERLG